MTSQVCCFSGELLLTSKQNLSKFCFFKVTVIEVEYFRKIFAEGIEFTSERFRDWAGAFSLRVLFTIEKTKTLRRLRFWVWGLCELFEKNGVGLWNAPCFTNKCHLNVMKNKYKFACWRYLLFLQHWICSVNRSWLLEKLQADVFTHTFIRLNGFFINLFSLA